MHAFKESEPINGIYIIEAGEFMVTHYLTLDVQAISIKSNQD
jgi:CRP-like cAMP-binding protein